MKILIIADYPRSGHPFSGIFNERSVQALKAYCESIEVLAHRPYIPRIASSLCSMPRWKTWAAAMPYEVRDGVSIYRPAYLQVPRIGSAFWIDQGAFLCCRTTARELHQRIGFDCILSFDLVGAGGLAWRIGRDLGIPASGWATGSDVRQAAGTRLERLVARTIEHLDLVFYQSQELFEIAAHLFGIRPKMMPKVKHVVLPRGIPESPSMHRKETRARVRMSLGINEDNVLVLSVGSIRRKKGVFELLEAVSLAVARNPRIYCVLLGSRYGFDETSRVQKILEGTPILKNRVKLLPACMPDEVWEYLCAADIFAFPSHNEGMPNSLLEAMAMGLPSIAFAIPAIEELEAGTGGLVMIRPFDVAHLSEAIVRLSADFRERLRIGERGKVRVTERFMVHKNMAEVVRRLSFIIEQRYSSKRSAERPQQSYLASH